MTLRAEDLPDGPAAPWQHEELLPGPHRLRCGTSSAYLSRPGGDAASLVDTGPDGTSRASPGRSPTWASAPSSSDARC
ncbi:hypothetical protein [Quadrisphaera setariae]|uniref:Uncharacterized protein n=1 Tax=Quadrisphaera setariae TaxID=2593304 RepID=A0A5C8Z264_9ACTN|nr:hypothetical protein [Quadrisphaera setariae]TXR51283.1 hypothetical protein FMM08_22525 [Quadrisphaera setariae]